MEMHIYQCPFIKPAPSRMPLTFYFDFPTFIVGKASHSPAPLPPPPEESYVQGGSDLSKVTPT